MVSVNILTFKYTMFEALVLCVSFASCFFLENRANESYYLSLPLFLTAKDKAKIRYFML